MGRPITPLFRTLSRALEQPGREVREAIRRRRESFPGLGQRGLRRHTVALFSIICTEIINGLSTPLYQVCPGERREETDRGCHSVFERSGNPLVSTIVGFDHQAPKGPLNNPERYLATFAMFLCCYERIKKGRCGA